MIITINIKCCSQQHVLFCKDKISKHYKTNCHDSFRMISVLSSVVPSLLRYKYVTCSQLIKSKQFFFSMTVTSIQVNVISMFQNVTFEISSITDYYQFTSVVLIYKQYGQNYFISILLFNIRRGDVHCLSLWIIDLS